MTLNYKALRTHEIAPDQFEMRMDTLNLSDLPNHDVCIQVLYSSLNYKDALSATGNKGVTKQYPHTPGIDVAGIVYSSQSTLFKTGDPVVVTGYDLGMNTPGGFGEYIKVPAEWVVPLPKTLSPKDAMTLGTAGFTAALCVNKLLVNGLTPDQGEVLVTGATGGVGSIAVKLLAQLGFEVTASTGKPDDSAWLKKLGASHIIQRDEILVPSEKAMVKGRWAGTVDTVGGQTLVSAIKASKFGASVATCGNVSDFKIAMTVYPFILNNVNLLGVSSAGTQMPLRSIIWEKLSHEWHMDLSAMPLHEVTLEALPEIIQTMKSGKHSGRTLICHTAALK